MVDRGADARQTDRDVDSAIKPEHLDGDMPLIVVHDDDNIELIQVCRAVKDTVRRHGARNIPPLRLRLPNRRYNLTLVLVAEETALAAVWVKPCNSNAWFLNAHQLQRLLRKCDHVGDAVFFHAPRHIMQGNMCRHMDDTQLWTGEHHGVLRLPHEAAKDLRMPRIVYSAKMQCLLVQWRSDNGMNLMLHGISTGTLDVLVRRPSCASIHLCKGEVGREIREVDDVDCPRLIAPICRCLHAMAAHRCADNMHRTLHDLRVAIDERTCDAVHLCIRKCLDDDLRADTRCITHRDSKNWT